MNQGPYNPYNAPGPYNPPGQYMGPPGGPMSPMGSDYEFNDAENGVIANAAFWAKLLGIFMIVTGVASLMNCNVLALVVNLLVGITFLGASTSLGMVVNTQGNDIVHMMQAMGKLRSAFKIRVIVVIISLVFIAVVFVGILALVLLSVGQSR